MGKGGIISQEGLRSLNKLEPQAYKKIIVKWKGDIDNDGEFDYIISDSCCGEVVSTYLYLSTQFLKEKVMKPVSVFKDGYCC